MAGQGVDLGSVWASVGLRLNQLFSGISQAQTAMRNLDRQMTAQAQQTSNRVASIFDNLGRNLERILTGAFSIYAVRRFAQELDDLAATAFQAQAGLNIFARQVARIGEDLDASLRLLAGLADELRVPQEVLARSAAELLRYGYSVQQIVDIFRGAVASGLLVGRTTVESINTVTEALVSQRSVLLNVIGITENLDPALVRYARSLGKTADELTNAERATAAWQMITRATAAEVADLNLLLEGYGGAVADVGTQSYNLHRVLGDALLPAVTDVRRAWADMLNTLARLAQTSEVQSAIRSAAQAVVWLTEKLRDGVQWIAAHRDAIQELVNTTLPALVAILTATVIPKLVQLGATLLLTAGKWMLIVSVVALFIDAFRFFERETQLLGNMWRFIADFFAALPALFAEGPEALAKREQFAQSAREFGESLKKTFSHQGLETAQAWWESFSQRMAQVWDMITGKTSVPLPELQPVMPTVSGVAAGLTGADQGERRVSKVDEILQKLGQSLGVVEDAASVLGEAFDVQTEKVTLFEKALVELLEAGVDPASGHIKWLSEQLARLRGETDVLVALGMADPLRGIREAFDRVRASRTIEGARQSFVEFVRTVRDHISSIENVADLDRIEKFLRSLLTTDDLRTMVAATGGGVLTAIIRLLGELDERRKAVMEANWGKEAAEDVKQLDEALEELRHRARMEDWQPGRLADELERLIDPVNLLREGMEHIPSEKLSGLRREIALLRKEADASRQFALAMQEMVAALREAGEKALLLGNAFNHSAAKADVYLATIERLQAIETDDFELKEKIRVVIASLAREYEALTGKAAEFADTTDGAMSALSRFMEETVRSVVQGSQSIGQSIVSLVSAFRTASQAGFTFGQTLRAAFAGLRAYVADAVAYVIDQIVGIFAAGRRAMDQLRAQAVPVVEETQRAREQFNRLVEAGFQGSFETQQRTFTTQTRHFFGLIRRTHSLTVAEATEATKDWIQRMTELLHDFTGRAASLLVEAFRIPNLGASWAHFTRGLKDQLYTMLVEGITKAFAQSAVVTRAVAPFLQAIDEISQAIAEGRLTQAGIQLAEGTLAGVPAILEPAIRALEAQLPGIRALFEALHPAFDAIRQALGLPAQAAAEAARAAGMQISEITGPTRDLLVELLRPLTGLNTLPGILDGLRQVFAEIRDLLARVVGAVAENGALAFVVASASVEVAEATMTILRAEITVREAQNIYIAGWKRIADLGDATGGLRAVGA